MRRRRRVELSAAVTMMDTLCLKQYFLCQCAVAGALCVFAADGFCGTSLDFSLNPD